MKQTAVITAILGVFARNAQAQGVQCSGSRTHWGLSQFQQNKVDVNCWLDWSGWSECSGHCGQAMITATRLCRGNIPGLGGCQGSELKRKRCSDSKIVQGRETNLHVLIWNYKLGTTWTNLCRPLILKNMFIRERLSSDF